MLKEAKKSNLVDIYPKNYEGYDHWHKFITKDYYEHHMLKEKSVYEVCQCKDPD